MSPINCHPHPPCQPNLCHQPAAQGTQRLASVITAGVLVMLLIILAALPATAQDDPTPTPSPTTTPDSGALTCAALAEPILQQVAEACFDQPGGSLCYGSGPLYPTLHSTSVARFETPGDTALVRELQALQGAPLAADGATWGVALAHYTLEAPLVLVAFGEFTLLDAGGSTPWASLDLLTLPPVAHCPLLPSALLAQSADRLPLTLTVNSVAVTLDGTVLLQAPSSDVLTVSVVAGTAEVANAAGETQRLGMGQGMRITAGEPLGLTLPYNRDVVAAAPLRLLNEVVPVPYPGAVEATGQVNVRVRPTTDSGVVEIVEPGALLGRLGRSPAGDWEHVVLPDGLTGWVFNAFLRPLVPEAEPPAVPIYEATPAIPAPLGPRARLATVLGEGIYLRSGPGQIFDPLLPTLIARGTRLELLARNAVGDWLQVRVTVDGRTLEGWVYRLGVSTQAAVEALAVPAVLPTPTYATPTPLPGSFGGAFPPPGATFTPVQNVSFSDAYFVYDATRCPPGREEGADLAVYDADGTPLLSWSVRTGGGAQSDRLTVAADYTIQIRLIRYYADTGEGFMQEGIPFILGQGQTTYYPACGEPDPHRFPPTSPPPEAPAES